MQLHLYSTAHAFLNATQPALEAAEAANNLMYGLALRIREFPERFLPAPYLSAVLAEDQLQVAALMTPPHNLVVFSNNPAHQDQAFALIAQNLFRDELECARRAGSQRSRVGLCPGLAKPDRDNLYTGHARASL